MRALFHALIAAGVFSTLGCMVVLFELSTEIPPVYSEHAAVYAVHNDDHVEVTPSDTPAPPQEYIPIVAAADDTVDDVTEEREVEEERMVIETEVSPAPVPASSVVSIEPSRAPTPIPTDTFALHTANQIHKATNIARSSENLEEYREDAELSRLAAARSEEMAALDYFSHTSPSGCDMDCYWEDSGYEATRWGENIAWYDPYARLTPEKLAEKFVHDWVQSRGHRENLLSSEFTRQGIGVALDGTKLIVTVIFAEPQ